MKKFAALLLAGTMVLSMAACGSSKTETTVAETEEAVELKAGTPIEALPDTIDTTGVDYSSIKVGLITLHDENSTYDKNFIDCMKEACSELGIPDENLLIKSGIDESDACYEAACDLADSGCNFVFADSFGHESYIMEAAEEYPEVQFAHATGTQAHTAGLSNFHNAFASIYEGRYLAGVAAGMKINEMIDAGDIKEDEAKMGYVGAYTYAEVISGYTAFYLGAKSVCPSVTMEVSFTGSWYDETAEKEGAQALIEDGCVLISQHADSMGAPTACETAGVPNVTYNGSTVDACPNTYLCSSRVNWEPYFVYAITAIAKGEDFATDIYGTMTSNSVQVLDLGSCAAEGTQEKLAEVLKGLNDGSIKVFDTSTFTVDGKAVTTSGADVDTDANYTADTEAIADGCFEESLYRSAPYFTLQIDGITFFGDPVY